MTPYLTENPAAKIKKPSTNVDRRRKRRALSVEQLRHFIATTAKQPTKGRATGEERALIYRTMAETGLRVSEIRSIKPINLRLDGENPFIIVDAADTKNGKRAEQPIPMPLALAIKAHMVNHPNRQRVFQLCANARRIEIYREDLKAADIEYVIDGEYFDLHSLRVTYITNLGRAGVPLTMAQKLARHSDPRLTANVYSWAGIEEKSAAVNSLPSIA